MELIFSSYVSVLFQTDFLVFVFYFFFFLVNFCVLFLSTVSESESESSVINYYLNLLCIYTINFVCCATKSENFMDTPKRNLKFLRQRRLTKMSEIKMEYYISQVY